MMKFLKKHWEVLSYLIFGVLTTLLNILLYALFSNLFGYTAANSWGNVLDNACKYCLEFVEISARQTDEHLYIVVEDDGPGIPLSKREVIFDRGQRVDTLRPGQGVGLAVAREITEQYEGKIVAGESMMGGARMEVIFGRQHSAPKDE